MAVAAVGVVCSFLWVLDSWGDWATTAAGVHFGSNLYGLLFKFCTRSLLTASSVLFLPLVFLFS